MKIENIRKFIWKIYSNIHKRRNQPTKITDKTIRTNQSYQKCQKIETWNQFETWRQQKGIHGILSTTNLEDKVATTANKQK